MNTATLIPVDDMDGCPFPFFDDTPAFPEAPAEGWYKIYNDGGHFVATRVIRSNKKPVGRAYEREAIDILFDGLFTEALKKGLNNYKKEQKMTDYIKSGMLELYPDHPDLDGFIKDKIKRKYHNIGVRKKRFRRKAYLNKWNYFVTLTYDDKKHDEITFRQKIRKCLSNLHTRRGWRYMGVFEYSPEKERLHFHGVFYIPDGEMLGKITEKKSYSPQEGRMKTRYENSFFQEAFGVNDFQEVSEMTVKHGHAFEYILKYMEKQGERIVYSRGIATEICKKMDKRAIITAFTDYVEKFVLFDDVISWETDIMRYKPKQMTMIDLICNPPLTA